MVNPFQPSIAFHVETSHLICFANQITGFYMKCNNGLKWVNLFIADVPKDPIEEKIKLNAFHFVGHELIFRKISVEVSFYSYSLLICNITERGFQCGYSPINFRTVFMFMLGTKTSSKI